MTLRKQKLGDPTDVPTAEQSTKSSGRLSGGRPTARSRSGERVASHDLLNRNRSERYDTPRRYEEEDER